MYINEPWIASLIFLFFFWKYRSLKTQITCQNNQGSSSNNLYTLPLPLNRVQKGELIAPFQPKIYQLIMLFSFYNDNCIYGS